MKTNVFYTPFACFKSFGCFYDKKHKLRHQYKSISGDRFQNTRKHSNHTEQLLVD